jgi:uncharacterized protein with ATP-grasp and redox domains
MTKDDEDKLTDDPQPAQSYNPTNCPECGEVNAHCTCHHCMPNPMEQDWQKIAETRMESLTTVSAERDRLSENYREAMCENAKFAEINKALNKRETDWKDEAAHQKDRADRAEEINRETNEILGEKIAELDWFRRKHARATLLITRAMEYGLNGSRCCSAHEATEIGEQMREFLAGRAAAEGSADETGESKSGAGSASA